MSPVPSMAEVLESLRTQIAHHREQEALHGEREAFHHQRRAAHAAELEQLTRHLAAFEAAVSAAADLAAGKLLAARSPSAPARRFGQHSRFSINTAVFQAISGKRPHTPFGPREVAAEVNERFRERLGHTVDERQVSVSLRWLAANRYVVLVEKGRPHREAKYALRLPSAP